MKMLPRIEFQFLAHQFDIISLVLKSCQFNVALFATLITEKCRNCQTKVYSTILGDILIFNYK